MTDHTFEDKTSVIFENPLFAKIRYLRKSVICDFYSIQTEGLYVSIMFLRHAIVYNCIFLGSISAFTIGPMPASREDVWAAPGGPAPIVGGTPAPIVGGTPTAASPYPWQVSLRYTATGDHFCGGAIISDRWVMTAAHCMHNMNPKGPFDIAVGMYDQEKRFGKVDKYRSIRAISHEEFDIYGTPFMQHDITLVKTDRPIDLTNPYVSVIPMAPRNAPNFVDGDCKLTGWGLTEGGSMVTPVLMEVATTAITSQHCEQLSQSNPFGSWIIKPTHICFFNGQGGACRGDSGGPAVCRHQGKWVLAGVTSGGTVGCSGSKPSVYTRVSAYRDWVHGKTGI